MELVVGKSNARARRNDRAVQHWGDAFSIAFTLSTFGNGRRRRRGRNRGGSKNGSPKGVRGSITRHLYGVETESSAAYSGNSGGWGGDRYVLDNDESRGKQKVPRTYRGRPSGVGNGERNRDSGRESSALDGGRCSWEKVRMKMRLELLARTIVD
jgi:hypothetical protein